MTIKECIDIVDDLKPNQYSTKVKVMWLSFIDEIIINDVLKTHKGYDGRYDDFTGYSEDKLSVPLIVKSPYDRLYTAYLKMKIDAENGETARYNNSASLFNSYLMEYKKFYNKTHMPLSEAEKRAITPVKNTSCGISEADLENLEREIYAKLYEDFSGMVSDDKLYSIVSNYVINNIEMLKENRDVDLAIEGIKTDLKSKADLIDGKVPLSQLTADSIYNPESHNPQSGIAVAEAVEQVNMALSAAVYKGFVAKENGKGLSQNDYTDDDKKQVDNSIKIAGISNGELSFEMNAGVYNIKAFTNITFRTYTSSSDGMMTMGSTKLGSTSTDTFLFVSSISTIPSCQIKEFRLSGGNRETVYRITRATNATTGEYTDTLTDETPKVDQTYTPTSPNAQSGLATAEAVGVANDYTDKAIKSSKTYANNNFAPVIKNTVSGSVLAVHDVSPAEHDLDVSVRGKNLLNPIEIKQVYTSTTNFGIYAENPLLLPSGTYTFKYYGSDVVHQLNIVNSDTSTNIVLSYNKSVATFTLTEATHICISLYNTNGFTEYGEGYYQLELGTTATEYTPYVADLSAVGVSRLGKNLSPTNTLEVQGIGGWTYKSLALFNIPDGTYTFSCACEDLGADTAKNTVSIRDIDEEFITEFVVSNGGSTRTFTTTNGLKIYLYSNCSATAANTDVVFKNIQLEVGSTATDYEPYIEPQTVTANADGTVEGLTSVSPDMTVTTDTEGVVIDMTYNADTKMYIDNKLAEISTAIVNNV